MNAVTWSIMCLAMWCPGHQPRKIQAAARASAVWADSITGDRHARVLYCFERKPTTRCLTQFMVYGSATIDGQPAPAKARLWLWVRRENGRLTCSISGISRWYRCYG